MSVTGSLASTLGTDQPFRYRGYIYDTETGYYYLRSRYYYPIWQRFINADSLIEGNLFCYCHNEPVIQGDISGKKPDYIIGLESDDMYLYYGVGPEIANAIDIILNDETSYAYSEKDKNGKYIYGIYNSGSHICVCCVYLICGLLGGRKKISERKKASNAKSIQKDTIIKPGMEVYQGSHHCGLIIMYDFGYGYELAVFQSVSKPFLSEGELYNRGKYMNDNNAGPNIVPFIRDNWDEYGTPEITDENRFFFDPSDKHYLWK